jgi:hypothetical protein
VSQVRVEKQPQLSGLGETCRKERDMDGASAGQIVLGHYRGFGIAITVVAYLRLERISEAFVRRAVSEALRLRECLRGADSKRGLGCAAAGGPAGVSGLRRPAPGIRCCETILDDEDHASEACNCRPRARMTLKNVAISGFPSGERAL